MSEKTGYESNIDKLATLMSAKGVFYLPVPDGEALIEFVKALYSEEDAAVCANMNVFPGSESPEEIAEKIGIKSHALIPLLDCMVLKGLVFRIEVEGKPKYGLLSVEPGLVMTSFGKGEDTERSRKLAAALNKLFDTGGLGQKYRSREVPLMRVLPVEKEIQAGQVVLPYERVSEYIKNVSFFAVAHCQCKVSKKLLDQPCAHGPETEHCMLFDGFGRMFVETGFAREITRDEAYELIKRTQDLGLIHLSVNTRGDYNAICNCCSCCCLNLRALLHFHDAMGRTSSMAPSAFFAAVEREICNGCRDLSQPVCVDKCPVSAIGMKDNKAVVNAGKCIGCGICSYSCPVEGAVSLIRRNKDLKDPPEVFTDLVMEVIASQ